MNIGELLQNIDKINNLKSLLSSLEEYRKLNLEPDETWNDLARENHYQKLSMIHKVECRLFQLLNTDI